MTVTVVPEGVSLGTGRARAGRDAPGDRGGVGPHRGVCPRVPGPFLARELGPVRVVRRGAARHASSRSRRFSVSPPSTGCRSGRCRPVATTASAVGPPGQGLDRSESAADEPDPRDQPRPGLRRRRAGRHVERPGRGAGCRRAPPDGLDHRSRVGQRHRQLPRARHDVHALRPGLHGALRHGGRPRQRRDPAHGHGCDAQQQDLAPLQAWHSGRLSTRCSCSPTSAWS